jgi:hypothetical protein
MTSESALAPTVRAGNQDYAIVNDPLAPELTLDELAALEQAARLDAGDNAEALADKAHDVAYRATCTSHDLRELAGLCLVAARRCAPGA